MGGRHPFIGLKSNRQAARYGKSVERAVSLLVWLNRPVLHGQTDSPPHRFACQDDFPYTL